MKVSEFNEKKIYSEASGSCAVVDENIVMELNDFGLYEERVLLDSDSELNPLVEFVSPSLNKEIDESKIATVLFDNVNEIKHDMRIGYYKSLYAGHVSEGDYREKASSGGMGTWIFKELFENKLIDGVIHVKENSDKDSPVLFHYNISRSIEEIKEGAKTKYYPVEFSKVLNIVKEVPGRYAIIGIPSFIMAIRLLAEKDNIIKERIRFTIGLICGHQKSSKFAEFLAWQVGVKPNYIQHIDFRKKLLDNPANNYGIEIVGIINDEEVNIIKSKKQFIGQNWGQGFFKTMSSDFTDDVMNETADITIGDAWLQGYTNDSKGNNVIIVRNPILDHLIKGGIKSERLRLDVVDKEVIFQSQAAHYRHTHDELAYRLYKKDKAKEWRPHKRVEASKNIPFLRRKVQDLREDISTQSHIIYKKAVESDDLNYYKKEIHKLTRKYDFIYKLILINKIGYKVLLKKILKKYIDDK